MSAEHHATIDLGMPKVSVGMKAHRACILAACGNPDRTGPKRTT
jgi:hypothetical protein